MERWNRNVKTSLRLRTKLNKKIMWWISMCKKSYLVLAVATLRQETLTAFVNVNSTICKMKWEIKKMGTKQ